MNTIIKTEGLSRQYRFGKTTVSALNSVDVAFESGTYYAVMGPSGSGKSSLLNILGLLDAPTHGRLFLDGQPISNYSDRNLTLLRQKKIGFIFQSFCLIPTLNARANVALPLRILGQTKREADKTAQRVLEEVGLGKRATHLPAEMSGGERQRTAIARAIVKAPRFILADEPTGNLDSATSREIVAILRGIVERHRTTVIQVTHDAEIGRLSDKILNLKDGQLIN